MNEEKVINSVMLSTFPIEDYNFDQLEEISNKAKKIIEPILSSDLIEHTLKYFTTFCFDGEVIEKTCDLLKVICKYMHISHMNYELNSVVENIRDLKLEYKIQKINF